MKSKFKIPSMQTDLENEKGIAVIAFIIILISLTTILVIFEIVFFHLLFKMWYAGRYELWIFQIVAITGYLVAVYLTAHSKICRVIYLFSQLILSCFILGLVMWMMAFWTIKLTLLLIVAVTILGLIASFKSQGGVITKVKVKSLVLLMMVTFSTLFAVCMFAFLPKTTRIVPQSEPEIIFWCGSNQLPNDTETLTIAKKYNIGYVPTIRKSYVNHSGYMSVYKNIIAHGVSLHFAIGSTNGFYATLDNAEDFPEAYKEIRDWFDAEGILDSKYVKSFCVDAETPSRYISELEGVNPIEGINYISENFPTQNELEKAEKHFTNFTNMIREDGKEVGIIRIGDIMDSCDGDGDLTLATRNIYTLNVEWDYSVSMYYRTQRQSGIDEEVGPIEEVFSEFANIFMGIFTEGTRYTLSEYFFYNAVAMAQTPSEINVDSSKQHIFIGNFKMEFNDTEYIMNKNYLRDVDICRHFGEEQIWIYELSGFVYHYGWDEMERLGKHIQQYEEWDMRYDSDNSVRLIMMYAGMILLDLFAKYEEDFL